MAVIALNACLYTAPIYRLVGADAVLWVNNLTNVAAAMLSVWLAWRLWRSFRRGEILGTIWGSLAIGLALWTVAELVWDFYQFVLGAQAPSVSPADLAWVLGYIALISGLVLRLVSLRMRLRKAWQFVVLALFAILTIPVFIYFILPILNDTNGGLSLAKLVDLIYPLGDLVLAFMALLLVLVLEGGVLSRPWTAIALGCFCVGASDLLYAYAVWRGIYQAGPAAGPDLLSAVIDTSYTFAYVLVALGLYLQARMQDAI